MTETKLHYKLYKTKHGWVTATIAATALAIPVIGGSVTHASADTTAATGTQTVTSGSNAVTATTASATSITSNTQSVTPDSSKLDQAVQNAKSTANVTVNQTPTQTVTGSTVAEAKQKAEQDYQNQATQINQKVANQKANNDATNAANSFNMDNSKKRELDQAVQNAKSTANVNVKQTQTQIYNTGVSGVENTKNKINDDYSTQINNINQAVSTQKAKNDAYNKAVAEANTLNSTADTTRKKLDDAIKAAQAVKGVTVIDGGTTTATVSVSDFEAKKKQIQDQNTQQANSINAQIQQYSRKLDEYKKTLAKGEIATTDIYNDLHLQDEQQANMTWRVLNNSGSISTKEPGGVSKEKSCIRFTQNGNGDLNGDYLEVTMSNLQGSDYKGVKLGKIVLTFSNAKHATISTLKNGPMWLDIHSNIVNGMYYNATQSFQTTMNLYDRNGNLIELGNDNSAWIAIKSLNALYWKDGSTRNVEEVRLDSNGTGYKLKGSTVIRHSDGFWYSDETNDSYGISEDRLGKINHIPYGTGWDGNPDLEYMGSTLFNVTGNKVTLTFKNVDTESSTNFKSGADKGMAESAPWVIISTNIMKDSSGIVPPTVKYNHTNVALG